MKSSLALIYLFVMNLSLFSITYANEDFLKIGYEADAFMQAQDYDKASSIFEELAKRELPLWQHSLVMYNLGTVKLAQHKNEEALEDYQWVLLDAATTPQIIRSLYINQGIAWLNQAQKSKTIMDSFEFIENLDHYATSLKLFKQVNDLDCQLKKLEVNDLAAPCVTPSDLEMLLLQSKIGLQQTKKDYIVFLLKTRPIWALSTLMKSMQQLNQEVETFNSWESEEQKKDYQKYILHQADSLQEIWEVVLNLQLNSKQKSSVNESAEIYQQSIMSIQKMELQPASQSIKQAIKNIERVIDTFADWQLQALLLNYQMHLLQNDWTAASLENLKEQQQQLEESNSDLLKAAKKYLDSSIENTKNSKKGASEFYLWAAFQTLNQINPIEQIKPTEILGKLLNEAWIAKQLTQLYLTSSEDQKEAQAILKNSWQWVLEEAKLFLPAVIIYEREAFNSKDPRIQHCQDKPWDKVIPLFDQGYQFALAAKELMHQPEQALMKQKKSITSWKNALKFLLQSSQISNSNLEKQDHEQKAANIKEMMRLIQEMQAQDQPPQKPSDAELHSW